MTTEERVEKLERELVGANQLNRRLLAVVGFGIVGLALAGVCVNTTGTAGAQAGEKAEKVIRAREFVLVDDQGRERAFLAMTKGGPGLALKNEKGQICVGLAVTKDVPGGLSLWDEKGETRAMLDMGKDGPEMHLYDEKGTERARLAVTKNVPMLALWDEKGQNRKGTERALLAVTKDGPTLSLWDEKGEERATLGVDKDRAVLRMYDPSGKPIWSAP